MKYKAIIFDLDGTLVDSMWIWKQIDIDFLAIRGISLPDDLQVAIEGMSFTETALYFKNRFGLPETVEEITNEWHRDATHYYLDNTPLKPGVREFLELARSNGYKLGVATSNSQELARGILEQHGVLHYFETIRTSCEVECSKPSPDVYLAAAKDLNVHPTECIAFEDTLAGTTAAFRAKMLVYGIKDATSMDNFEEISLFAEKMLEDFHEAIPIIFEM